MTQKVGMVQKSRGWQRMEVYQGRRQEEKRSQGATRPPQPATPLRVAHAPVTSSPGAPAQRLNELGLLEPL